MNTYDSNMLAARLTAELSETANEVISPLGIKTVLGLLTYGTTEEMQKKILNLLGSANLEKLVKNLSDEREADERYKLNDSKTNITVRMGKHTKGIKNLNRLQKKSSRRQSMKKKQLDYQV